MKKTTLMEVLLMKNDNHYNNKMIGHCHIYEALVTNVQHLINDKFFVYLPWQWFPCLIHNSTSENKENTFVANIILLQRSKVGHDKKNVNVINTYWQICLCAQCVFLMQFFFPHNLQTILHLLLANSLNISIILPIYALNVFQF
jgi:hypothetical protein